MKQQRKSKTAVLINELTEKIKNGNFHPGSAFPTTKELMLQYRISSASAGKVIRTLKTTGLIDAGKGRKSTVTGESKVSPFLLDKPIGIVSPKIESFRMARWRDLFLHQIQKQILDHGNQPLWLREDFELETVKDTYAGIIYSGELVPPDQWKFLMDANIPCAKISFAKPSPNTIFIDYRTVMDQIAIHLIKNKCRRVILLTTCEFEDQGISRWEQGIRFFDLLKEYDIPCSTLLIIPDENIGLEELNAEIAGSTEKTAFISSSSWFNSMIMKVFEKHACKNHENYELYSLSCIENEISIGNNVDLKYQMAIDKMLELFYRQCSTGSRQFGEILFAEFIPGAR